MVNWGIQPNKSTLFFIVAVLLRYPAILWSVNVIDAGEQYPAANSFPNNNHSVIIAQETIKHS